MSTKNRPITSDERAKWAELGHLLILQCLSEASEWSREDFAFHGGTSLHLSWNSPRFSEDLDFLLERKASTRLNAVIEKATARMRQALVLVDPELQVEVRDKSNDRMGHFQFFLSKPGVLGKAMVKAEFWRVAPTYLAFYETTARTPAIPTDLGGVRLRIDAMLPAATLSSALCDKLTAFATRPHLKWRDMFDFWWIQRQGSFSPASQEDLRDRFLHHVSAYQCTVPGDPAASLRVFADQLSDPAVIEQAQKDLRPFVPTHVWSAIWPDEVKRMVDDAAAGARRMAETIERSRPAEGESLEGSKGSEGVVESADGGALPAPHERDRRG